MKAAQDKLLLTLDLRAEALRKIAADLPTALGRGQAGAGTRSSGSPARCSPSSPPTSSTRRASRR